MRSTATFVDLRHTDAMRWQLPVIGRHTGGRGSLFGGVGLAAGIAALEQASGKPVVWAAGQYLAITQPGDVIDLEVTLPAVGRSVTQGRMVGHVGEREIITVLGALGSRDVPAAGCWVDRPTVAAPEDCDRLARDEPGDHLHNYVELRIAGGMFGFSGQGEPRPDGRNLLWARMPGYAVDAETLAVIADYMPSALGSAMGRVMYCTSLDNTIRFGRLVDTDWVLCDNRVEFVGDGFGYGTVHLWAEDGTLLATASQSMIVRDPQA